MTVSVTRFALHLLHSEGETLVDEHGLAFDMRSYSRFKYGNASIGHQYGVRLAESFIDLYPAVAGSNEKIVVAGPSYKYLGTASQGISRAFSFVLNAFRVAKGLEPVYQLHVIRSSVGNDTYAMGDAAYRALHLASNEYHIDRELVEDSTFIFIDDVNVTGATEDRTLQRTMLCRPTAIYSLHVAQIDSREAMSNAAIENVMNKTIPVTLSALDELIKEGNFRLNSRVFRTIMEWSQLDELERFLLLRTDRDLIEMYDALVGGTAEMYGRKPQATAVLEKVLAFRELLPHLSVSATFA